MRRMERISSATVSRSELKNLTRPFPRSVMASGRMNGAQELREFRLLLGYKVGWPHQLEEPRIPLPEYDSGHNSLLVGGILSTRVGEEEDQPIGLHVARVLGQAWLVYGRQ